jgi:gentisate 1,2-dioxygenase
MAPQAIFSPGADKADCHISPCGFSRRLNMLDVVTNETERLDRDLKADFMEGHWITGDQAEVQRTYTMNPHTFMRAHLWDGENVFGHRKRAGEVHGLAALSDRRTIRLVNPALIDNPIRRDRTSCHTMPLCIQLST